MKCKLLLIIGIVAVVLAARGREMFVHSHNDYAQKRPFWGAYEAGADSIEADVFLVDGELIVAHSRRDLKPENTLRRLYLEPLRTVFRKNGGRARANGEPLQLLVDLKNGKPAFDALVAMIEREGFRDCFDVCKNPAAARLTVTGDNSGIDFSASPAFVFFDVPSNRELDAEQYRRVWLVSDYARIHTKWRSGAMAEGDKKKIRDVAARVHAKGALYRLWGFPDHAEAWRLSRELGLDYVNTDRPAAAVAFLASPTCAERRFEPRGDEDRTAEVLAAVRNGATLRFANGEYHFRSPAKLRYYISNHDNPQPHSVFLPVTNVTDFAMHGDGAVFVFHGSGIGMTVMDTRRVTLKGIALEWARPPFTEAKVEKVDDGGIVLRSDSVRFPLAVEKGKLIAVGEGWRNHVPILQAFAGDTLDPLRGIRGMGKATALGDGTIRLEMGKPQNHHLRVGDIALMRSPYRPSPGVSLCRAHDTLVEDCSWHGGDGMGLVAQRCENVTVRGSGKASDRTAGAFARKGSGCETALQADATHFSNCKGQVLVENCYFQGTVDDAINVHSTALRIEGVPKPDTLVCRYMHKQSTGFEVFLPGERLRFIKAATLEPGFETVVKDARITDPRHVMITLEEPVPQKYAPGDAVENADWQPSVVFRNNIVRKIIARAVLLTTPGKTVIEGNLFDRVSSQVIQLEGDASGWYESGACRDVTIRDNVFRNCAFMRGEGIVQIRPNLKDLKSQKERYHRNIVIERNRFETPRIPLLRACSVSNLVWRDNEVIYNESFPARGKEPFVMDYSENIDIR